MSQQISPEQYQRSQKQCSLAAQQRLAWWVWNHPTASREAILGEARRLIDVFGRAGARLACVYYMNHRDNSDGWQILPSFGFREQHLTRLLHAAYDRSQPVAGLRQVVDVAVKQHGRRTLERRRGYVDERRTRPAGQSLPAGS